FGGEVTERSVFDGLKEAAEELVDNIGQFEIDLGQTAGGVKICWDEVGEDKAGDGYGCGQRRALK
ncbi:MAG: hypothetical protein Q9192_007801, partial [Flavoplaca navasiana]